MTPIWKITRYPTRQYWRAVRKRTRMMYAGVAPPDYPAEWRISWGLDKWRLRNWNRRRGSYLIFDAALDNPL